MLATKTYSQLLCYLHGDIRRACKAHERFQAHGQAARNNAVAHSIQLLAPVIGARRETMFKVQCEQVRVDCKVIRKEFLRVDKYSELCQSSGG